MRFLLEYSEKFHCFECNRFCDGEFHYGPFTNGWMPVCVLTEEMDKDMDFLNFRYELASKKPSYQKTVIIISRYILEHYESVRINP